jgi:hypothetical protein
VAERRNPPCKSQGQLAAGVTIGGKPLHLGRVDRHDATVASCGIRSVADLFPHTEHVETVTLLERR